MRLGLLPVLLATLLLPPGAQDAQEKASEHAAAGRILDAVLARHGGGLALKIAGAEPLRISCPMGVRCDQDFDYRALTYSYSHPDFDVFLYFSFDPRIIGNWNDDAVRERFAYVYHIIHVKELKSRGWDARLGFGQPYRKGDARIQFLGLQDGKLRLKLRSQALSARGVREGCAPMDAPMPPECQLKGRAAVPFVSLDLALAVEDGILDCTGASRREDCRRGGTGQAKPPPEPSFWQSCCSWLLFLN